MREKEINPVGEKDNLTEFSQSLVQSLAMTTASKIRDEDSQGSGWTTRGGMLNDPEEF